MMQITGKTIAADRLVDLERTVDSLNGQLREMQWELYRVKAEPLSLRLWRTFVPQRSGAFMSAVCNRRIRPNTKVVTHGGV